MDTKKSEEEEENKDEVIHPDYLCGIGPWKPKWMQKLAHRNVYMISYCALNVCQGMFYTYMVSILSTLEKRFAVSSKVTGFIMTGNEFSAILFSLLVAYLGSNGHRPRWIACGMFISAIACFLMSLPEFVLPGNTALLEAYKNSSFQDVCSMDIKQEHCDEDADDNGFTAMAIVFLGLFVYGVGTLPMYSLGYTYIDDNVPKKNLPIYLGISMGLRILGPASGYMVAGAALKTYHNPKVVPDFGVRDPRWVGAWWLGFIGVACGIILTASFMLMFPKKLVVSGTKPTISRKEKIVDKEPKKQLMQTLGLPTLKEFPSALKRVVSNRVLMAITIEADLYLLGVVGFGTFMPKYLEAQFGQSASGASIITGASSVLVMILGFVGSGYVIHKYTPRARILAGYSLFLGLLHFTVYMINMNIKCEETSNVFGSHLYDRTLNITSDCNQFCHCTTQKFTPVCDLTTNFTYFSACHAGCTTYNSTSKVYSNCKCLDPLESGDDEVLSGKCPTECTAFYWYIAIVTIMRLLNSTERIGGTLIFLRSIEKRDKALAMGWISAVLCLLAFLPCTILYGAVVDSTCLVWEESCGEKGNCWVYDTDKLRVVLHGLTGGLILAAQIFQFYVWYKCKNLTLYEETPDKSEEIPAEQVPLKTKQFESNGVDDVKIINEVINR